MGWIVGVVVGLLVLCIFFRMVMLLCFSWVVGVVDCEFVFDIGFYGGCCGGLGV